MRRLDCVTLDELAQAISLRIADEGCSESSIGDR